MPYESYFHHRLVRLIVGVFNSGSNGNGILLHLFLALTFHRSFTDWIYFYANPVSTRYGIGCLTVVRQHSTPQRRSSPSPHPFDSIICVSAFPPNVSQIVIALSLALFSNLLLSLGQLHSANSWLWSRNGEATVGSIPFQRARRLYYVDGSSSPRYMLLLEEYLCLTPLELSLTTDSC